MKEQTQDIRTADGMFIKAGKDESRVEPVIAFGMVGNELGVFISGRKDDLFVVFMFACQTLLKVLDNSRIEDPKVLFLRGLFRRDENP